MPVAVGILADAYNVSALWTPASLTNLLGWWDASDATTFTYSSGVVVSQWNDKSGNNRHFAQSTVASQPSRNATLNALAGVTFDGTADYMTVDAGSDIIDISPWTFWCVVDFAARIDSDGRIMSARRSATGAADYQSPNAILAWRNGTSDNISAMSAATTSPIVTGGAAPMIIGSRMSGSQVFSRVATTESAGTAATAPANMRYFQLGALANLAGNPPQGNANRFAGAIFEAFICNASVTATDAVTYLSTKWGL